MCKWGWVGCVLATVLVFPVRAAEESVEITIRGRLEVKNGFLAVTVGEGELARTFTLVLPADPAMQEAARALDGKAAVVSGLWERKAVVLSGRPVLAPQTKRVTINGVEKVVPVTGGAVVEVQRKVIEFVRVKAISPNTR
jgi:hypothetical protein